MLETVEGIYHNGTTRFLEKPKTTDGKVIVTFLKESKRENEIKIDWDKVFEFDGHAKKRLGLLSHLNVDMKQIREERLKEKLNRNNA